MPEKTLFFSFPAVKRSTCAAYDVVTTVGRHEEAMPGTAWYEGSGQMRFTGCM